MTKAERDEARKLEALRNNLPKRLIAFSVLVANAWLEAGNECGGVKYEPLDSSVCTPWVRSQWAKVLKHRDALIRELGLDGMYYAGKRTEEQARNKAFFRSVDQTIGFVEQYLQKHMPGAEHADRLKVCTYILYAAFYDYWHLHAEVKSNEFRWLVQTFGTLCDRIIPKESMLVLPLNKIYWDTKDDLQLTHEFYFDPDQQTEEETYIRTVPSELMRAMNDWSREYRPREYSEVEAVA